MRPRLSMPATAATPPFSIPEFALYGEATRGRDLEAVHIELIETRSRQYDWHIDTHTHAGLFQVLFLFTGRVRANIDGDLWDCAGPVALTIHPSLAHGFDFSEGAQGYVVTIDQNMLFAAAGHEGDLFSALFVQPLAIELGRYGITANAVAPGFVVTDMTRAVADRMGMAFDEMVAEMVKTIHVGRPGLPDDIAHTVSYFADPRSSFVTGQVLYVAGAPKV